MRSCPNCARPVPDGAALCPNCGIEVPAVWPPPPAGQPGLSAPVVGRPPVTGRTWGDVTLGLVIAAALLLAWGLGLLLTPLLWVALKPGRPALARGLGWGAVASYVLLFGAVGACFYGLVHAGNP